MYSYNQTDKYFPYLKNRVKKIVTSLHICG